MPVTIAQTISDPITWEAAQQVILYQTVLVYVLLAVFGIFGIMLAFLGFVTPKRINDRLKEAIKSAKFQSEKTAQEVIDGLKKEVQTELSSMQTENKKLEQRTVLGITRLQFDAARTFAIISENLEGWFMGAFWWLDAIDIGTRLCKTKDYTFNEELFFTATKSALRDLNKVKNFESLNAEKIEDMKRDVKAIPDVLAAQKKKIQKKLNELEKKIPVP